MQYFYNKLTQVILYCVNWHFYFTFTLYRMYMNITYSFYRVCMNITFIFYRMYMNITFTLYRVCMNITFIVTGCRWILHLFFTGCTWILHLFLQCVHEYYIYFLQDVNEYYSLRYPKLYAPGLRNELFNKKVFAWSIVEGIVTSIVLFFIPYGAFHDGLSTSGTDMADSQAYGVVVASILVVAVNLRVNMFTLWICDLIFIIFIGKEWKCFFFYTDSYVIVKNLVFLKIAVLFYWHTPWALGKDLQIWICMKEYYHNFTRSDIDVNEHTLYKFFGLI